MKKQILILSVVCLVCATGCSLSKQNESSNEKQTNNENIPNRQEQFDRWQENFDEASSTDMIVGEKIMAMGSENEDGSVSAERIIIGGADMPDFRMQRPPADGGVSGEQPSEEGARQWTNNGERPNFQDMSDEERQQMREEMQARGFTGGMMRNGGAENGAVAGTRIRSGMLRLNGEIIEIDGNLITLKLDDGGSKLIFLSGTTAIMKAKSSVDNVNNDEVKKDEQIENKE